MAGGAFGGAGAGEVAHADPTAEQADDARHQHQDLLIGKSVSGGMEHGGLLGRYPKAGGLTGEGFAGRNSRIRRTL